jgi:hypothetical protein
MPRYRSQPRAKGKIGAQKIQTPKKAPGRGVVAPGFRPVRKGGKVVPSRSRPKRSPVFKPLPSAKSKALLPGKSKESRRTVIRSSPNPRKLSPSGQAYRVGRYKPGTIEYEKARLKSRSLGGEVYRALQKEEKRQEKLIRSVTGEKVNVELQNTKAGIRRGVSEKRSKAALGAEPVARDRTKPQLLAPGFDRKTGKKSGNQIKVPGASTPTLSTLNRKSSDPKIRAQQKRLDEVTRPVTQAKVKQANNLLNPQILPTRKGYKPKPTIEERAKAAEKKPLKTPKVLRPSASLPKQRGRKPYAYKQQARQMKYAAKQEQKKAAKDVKILRSRKVSLERRARAADRLTRQGVLSGETRAQYEARLRRERALAKKRADRKPLIDVKLDSKDILNAGKAVGGLLTKNVRDANDPTKIGDFGVPGKLPKGVAKGFSNTGKALVGAGKVAAGAGKFLYEAKKEQLGASPKSRIEIGSSGVRTSGPSADKLDRGVSLVYKVPAYSAEAVANNPGEQIPRLVKDYAEMIKSVPAGIYMAADQGPETVWEQIKKDYSRRYGALMQGKDKEFRKRLEREGVAAEVLDSFAVLTVAGKGVGAGLQAAATSGRVARAAAAANEISRAGGTPARAGRTAQIVSGVARRTTVGGRNAGSPRYIVKGGDRVRLRPTNNLFSNTAKFGADYLRGRKKVRSARVRRDDYRKFYNEFKEQGRRDGRSGKDLEQWARNRALERVPDVEASVRAADEFGAQLGDTMDILPPERGVRPEDIKPREGTVRVKLTPSAAIRVSEAFRSEETWNDLMVKKPSASTSESKGATELVNIYRASGDPRAEAVAQMVDAVEVEMARAGLSPSGRRPFTARQYRPGKKYDATSGKKQSIEVELPVQQANFLREMLRGRSGYFAEEQALREINPVPGTGTFIRGLEKAGMGERADRLFPIYRQQVETLVDGAIRIGRKSSDPAERAAARALAAERKRIADNPEDFTLVDDLRVDNTQVYLLERSGRAMKRALPPVKKGQARSDARIIFDDFIDPDNMAGSALNRKRRDARMNQVTFDALRATDADLGEQLRVQGQRKAAQDALPEDQRAFADAMTEQQVADVGRRTALGDQLKPGARFNPEGTPIRSENTRFFKNDMDAVAEDPPIDFSSPIREIDDSIQSLKDYESDWPFYGALNLAARALRDIDPEFIVQFDRRYLSGLLTGRELATHFKNLARLFNSKQFRGAVTRRVGRDLPKRFSNDPMDVRVRRAMPATARFIDPDTGKPVFLHEIELREGMRLQDEGFASASIGEGPAGAEFNDFIRSRISDHNGVGIIADVAPDTKIVMTSEAKNVVDGYRGDKFAENEVVLAADSVFEFQGFKTIDELMDEYEQGVQSRRWEDMDDYMEQRFRNYYEESLANHNQAVQDARREGRISSEQADKATWPGIPVFKVTSPDIVRANMRKTGTTGRFTEAQIKAQRRAAEAEGRLDARADAFEADPPKEMSAGRRGLQEQALPMVFSNRWFGFNGQVRRSIARASGAAFVAMRIEQSEIENLFRAELGALSDAEREGFFYALRFGIRNPEQARQLLPEWRERILNMRRESVREKTELGDLSGDMWNVFDEIPNIERLLREADQAFTPRLAEFTESMRQLAREKGLMDPTLNGDRLKMRMAEIGAQGRIVGVHLEDFADDPLKPTRREKESYIKAVEERRQELGLAQAGFFRGERRPRRPFADRAVGGTQAVLPDKQLKFRLIDYGASDTDPEVFLRGVMGNIKRRYNYNKVAEVADAVGSRIYRNMTATQILDAIDAGEVNPRDSVIWNSRVYNRRLEEQDLAIAEGERQAVQDALLTDRGISANPFTRNIDPRTQEGKRQVAREANRNLDDAASDLDTPDGQDRVHTALKDSVYLSRDDLASYEANLAVGPGRTTPAAEFERSGFMVIPKSAYNEIFAATKPSGAAMRTLSIAQGKVSRILLANPVWLQFQFASNALLTGLVSGTGPVSIIKAQIWWNRLPEEVKQAVSPYVGIHRWYDPQNKLGAAQYSGVFAKPLNDLSNGYRGLKTTEFWRKGANANPLTLILKGDNAQNNWFRRAVLYNSVKREAFKQMGEDMGQAIRIQAQIMDGLTGLGPEEAMRKLLSQRDKIEEHAQYVDSILGNWNTYTNFERRVMGRFVMFYGFLRFSTKLTFYTMPVQHPVTSAIMLKLGEMQRDELRRIFGADIPYWEIGNYYKAGGDNTRIEVARINPFFNLYSAFLGTTREQIAGANDSTSFAALSGTDERVTYDLGPEFQGLDPRNLFTFVPPYFTLLADQVTRSSNALGGKPWTSDRNATWDLPGKSNIGLQDRLQIALTQMLRLSPYYRALEKTGLPGREPNTPFGPLRGKQTSDSNLFTPNPVRYSQRDVRGRRKVRRNEKMIREQEKSAKQDVGELLGPVWVGTPGKPRIESAQQFEKERPGQKKKKKARRKKGLLTTNSLKK